MAVNRYDAPAQDRYFNTNVALPYEQLMGTVAAREAQRRREQDLLNKTYEDTKNIEYIAGSPDEQFVRDYLGKVDNLAGNYINTDLSDPVVYQKMRQEFNNITNRTKLQDIQTSATNWKQNLKLKAQLKAEGLYDPSLDEDPATSWDSTNGVYQYITSPFKNPRPVAEPYFNNLKPSDLPSEGDYLMSGITRDRINQVIDTKWGEFSNTSEGKLYVKKVAKENGLDYTNPTVVKQIATDYLKGVGEEYIHKNQMGATLNAQVRAARSKKDDVSSDRMPITQEQNIRSKDSFDPYNIGKPIFKNGNISHSQSGEPSFTTSPSNPFRIADTSSHTKMTQTDAAEQKANLAKFRETIPSLQGLNDEQTYTAYKQLTKDGKAFPDLNKISLPEIPTEQWGKMLYNDFIDRKIAIQDEFGNSRLSSTIDNTQNSALKDLGYTHEQFKKQLQLMSKNSDKASFTVSGLAQNGPEPGMLILEVPDRSGKGGNKGKPRKVYVSTSPEIKGMMNPTNDIYNNIRNFRSGITPVMDIEDPQNPTGEPKRVGVRVNPKPYYNSSTKEWQYEYDLDEGYINRDGSFDPLRKTTLNKIEKAQYNMLTNSNYMSTEFGFTKKVGGEDTGF